MAFSTVKGNDGLSDADHELGRILESEKCRERTWDRMEHTLFKHILLWVKYGKRGESTEWSQAMHIILDAITHQVNDTIGLWCDAVKEGDLNGSLAKALKTIHEVWSEHTAEDILTLGD